MAVNCYHKRMAAVNLVAKQNTGRIIVRFSQEGERQNED